MDQARNNIDSHLKQSFDVQKKQVTSLLDTVFSIQAKNQVV